MALPPPWELVTLAMQQPRRARLLGMAITAHPPDEGTVAMILGALERDAVAPALGAELLGYARHPSGAPILRRWLLHQALGPDVAMAAGIGLARVLGADARDDLTVMLSMAPSREGREGAARGLAELGTLIDAASITAAARERRIRARVGVWCAIRLPFDAATWLEVLESDDLSDRRLGTELVYTLVRDPHVACEQHLTALGPRAREAVEHALEDAALYMLPEKRETLRSWLNLD